MVGKSSRRKKAVAAGAVVGGVTLLGSIYLGKLAYDVKSDVRNLFEWLNGVMGPGTLWQELAGKCQEKSFAFEEAVCIIRELLPVARRPVFDFLVRFVDKNEFMKGVRACSLQNGEFVTNYFNLVEEKLDN